MAPFLSYYSHKCLLCLDELREKPPGSCASPNNPVSPIGPGAGSLRPNHVPTTTATDTQLGLKSTSWLPGAVLFSQQVLICPFVLKYSVLIEHWRYSKAKNQETIAIERIIHYSHFLRGGACRAIGVYTGKYLS